MKTGLCRSLLFVLPLVVGCAAGCAQSVVPDDAGNTPGKTPDMVIPADPVQAGSYYAGLRNCRGCHDPGDGSLSGQLTAVPGTKTYGTNLTPDKETGIGDWTDDDLATAIRTGIDNEGVQLCPSMPRFTTMSDAEVGAINAYMRSLKPVRLMVPDSICPPVKGGTANLPDAGAPEDLAMASLDLAVSIGDLAVSIGDLAVTAGDMAGNPSDMASRPSDMTNVAAPDLSSRSDGGAGPQCHPVVNEIQTAGNGGATDEFIELYNPCASSIDFTDVLLVYRSSAGVKDVALLQFAGKFAAGSYFLCAGAGYLGAADAYYNATSLAAKGGGVGLRDPNGALIDSVGYGDATNLLVEGAAAAVPGPAQSIERLPNGTDTGDNSKDFAIGAKATPGKVNK